MRQLRWDTYRSSSALRLLELTLCVQAEENGTMLNWLSPH